MQDVAFHFMIKTTLRLTQMQMLVIKNYLVTIWDLLELGVNYNFFIYIKTEKKLSLILLVLLQIHYFILYCRIGIWHKKFKKRLHLRILVSEILKFKNFSLIPVT